MQGRPRSRFSFHACCQNPEHQLRGVQPFPRVCLVSDAKSLTITGKYIVLLTPQQRQSNFPSILLLNVTRDKWYSELTGVPFTTRTGSTSSPYLTQGFITPNGRGS